MLKHMLARLLDLYLLGVASWALAWQTLRDRWGGLALLNAWAFWLIATVLPVGAWWLRKRPGRLSGRWLAQSWLLAGLALLGTRYPIVNGRQPRRQKSLPERAQDIAPSDGTDGPASQEHGEDVVEQPETPLRIMSMNLLRSNCNLQAVADAIRLAEPDVVVLQELQAVMHSYLHRTLTEYSHEYWQPHARTGGGLGVFSRYPFEPTGLWAVKKMRPFALRVTLLLPANMVKKRDWSANGERNASELAFAQSPVAKAQRTHSYMVDVYNVHLLSVGRMAMQKTRLSGNFRERERQVRVLLAEVSERGNPALLLGDHNMTEGNEAYRLMTSQVTDAWRAAGAGLGWTWPRKVDAFSTAGQRSWPMLRLDYCFCNETIEPRWMQVVREPTGSDHCPIVVDAVVRAVANE